jgi:HK97 family phage major capsid protein
MQESQALALCRNARMSSKVFRQPVLSVLPVAYWVDGDTGLKQTTTAAWKGVDQIAGEIAAILPIPEAVINDSAYPIWDEVRPAIAGAVAQKLDAAVFAGIENPRAGRERSSPARSQQATR